MHWLRVQVFGLRSVDVINVYSSDAGNQQRMTCSTAVAQLHCNDVAADGSGSVSMVTTPTE